MKRARQNEKRRLRNQSRKTRVKNVVRQVRQAVAQKNAEEAQAALKSAIPVHRPGGRQGHPALGGPRLARFPASPGRSTPCKALNQVSLRLRLSSRPRQRSSVSSEGLAKDLVPFE